MTLQLGDTAPDFEAETTEGRIRFHQWVGNSWAVLFSVSSGESRLNLDFRREKCRSLRSCIASRAPGQMQEKGRLGNPGFRTTGIG